MYILLCCTETAIHKPLLFPTYKMAYEFMKKEYEYYKKSYNVRTCCHISNKKAELNWGESNTYMWKIFKLNSIIQEVE